MTKTSVLRAFCVQREEKCIEFVLRINSNGDKQPAKESPIMFTEVLLICDKYMNGDYDLIMAWDSDIAPRLYLGHWNNGKVDG